MQELSALTLRAIMSNGSLEIDLGESLTKPSFLFGDSIQEYDNFMLERKEWWLHVIDKTHIFLPWMQRSYGLTYLQFASVPQKMDWRVVRPFEGATLGKFIQTNVVVVKDDRGVVCLLPSSV